MSERFKSISKQTPPDIKRRVKLAFDITDRMLDILEEKNMSQKELAYKLGKSESEISRWMTGTQNFTLETIAKIELALGETIIDVPKRRAVSATPSTQYGQKYTVNLGEIFIKPDTYFNADQTKLIDKFKGVLSSSAKYKYQK